jgi:hypothetical protein
MHSDREITQPILKYLLMIAFNYVAIGLINIKYLSDYTRAHAGHVML